MTFKRSKTTSVKKVEKKPISAIKIEKKHTRKSNDKSKFLESDLAIIFRS